MNDKIVVSIGTEPKQWVPTLVLRSSILRRTRREVEFEYSWTPEQGWHHLLRLAPQVSNGTPFSIWRWIVPMARQWSGRAIYLDADQVCLTDLAHLWETPLDGKSIALVRNAIGVFGKKVPEPGKWQTSVMLLNCSRLHGDLSPVSAVAKVTAGKLPYRLLQQADWIDDSELLEIDPAWNHFGISQPDTKILHWSHVKSQPYRNPSHSTAGVFERELILSVEAGHLSPQLVRSEVNKGHLHEQWYKKIEERGYCD